MSTKDQIKQLCKKYSVITVQEYIENYSSKLLEISRCNDKFSTANAAEDYEIIVGEITEATKRYYTFISKMPEDIKDFLLSLNTDNPIVYDDFKQAGIILDKTLNINSNVLYTMQAIRPRLYTMQLDAITTQLSSLTENSQIEVSAKGNQPIITSVTLNMPMNMQLEGEKTLSTYDKSIINGVNSLMESGNTAFSVPMLYHAMTGKQNPSIDEQLFDDISGKLDNMRRIMLSIDLTQEATAQSFFDDAGELLDVEQLSIEGYLLPLNKITGVVNGKKTTLYQVIQPPPLYTYSKLKRQLATAPISLLNAPITNNNTTIPLKTYLLQRIEIAKKSNHINSNSLTILYESVYRELGAEEQSKTQKMRIRRYTTTILDYFIQCDYIKSYIEYKEGRAIKGIHVEISDKLALNKLEMLE